MDAISWKKTQALGSYVFKQADIIYILWLLELVSQIQIVWHFCNLRGDSYVLKKSIQSCLCKAAFVVCPFQLDHSHNEVRIGTTKFLCIDENLSFPYKKKRDWTGHDLPNL